MRLFGVRISGLSAILWLGFSLFLVPPSLADDSASGEVTSSLEELEFDREVLYRWPNPNTMVWYVDGGQLYGESVILLSEVRFRVEAGRPILLPATLEILREDTDGWTSETLTEPNGVVFHKAVLFDDGILTISGGAPGSGQPGLLQHWRRNEDQWSVRGIWSGAWSGTLNRLRDFEYGDVDGDGLDELVIGTHDHGVIVVLDGALDGSERASTELALEANRYVHEIELVDMDGDGVSEILASRSDPNLSALSQAGTIECFRFDGETYVRETIWNSTSTHVKEILAADMDGDGRPEIFAAVEAERRDGTRQTPVRLLQWAGLSDGSHEWRLVAEIEDDGLRFMQAHDVDGQMPMELFLAPREAGLFLMDWAPNQPGELRLIDTQSGGFEHAIRVIDLDRDGRSELYVASDHEKSLLRFGWSLPER